MNSTVDAIGVWLFSLSTNRYLYLLRNDHKHPGAWGLPGGKIENNESLINAIERECKEELGDFPEIIKLIPIEQFTSPDGKFVYHTFFGSVEHEFIPNLNNEHLGYSWVDSGHIPKPLHPGLWSTINIDEIQSKIKIIELGINN